MHTSDIDRMPLVRPGRRIAADSCSLIFLNRLQLLEAYAGVHAILLTQPIGDEITRAPGAGTHAEDRSLYERLFSGNGVSFSSAHDAAGDISSALSFADRSLIQAFYTLNPDGILTDDKEVCRYCRRQSIPYINTPMALFVLLYNGGLSRQGYSDALQRLYTIGRYGQFVHAHMEEMYRAYCSNTPAPGQAQARN